MQVYRVGGWVRDSVMGKEPNDNDFCVTGSTEVEMLSNGFKKVGADFPVFLHPSTGDEYALARTERKTGDGYHGFTVDFGHPLNPEMQAEFVNRGYNLDCEYDIDELIEVFRRITQSNEPCCSLSTSS